MYIFRALNEEDEKNIKNGDGILARKQSKTDVHKFIGTHVKNASKEDYEDCWISTCKLFDICATEYAIPQGGGYNTAKYRKNIAVIDVGYWKNIKATKECYTIFHTKNEGIVDFSEPLNIQINDKKPAWSVRYTEIQEIRKILEQAGEIDKALFDCSFPRKKNAPIDKLDLMSFSKERKNRWEEYTCFGFFDFGVTAVQNGVAQEATEVLCLNNIPKEAIKAVLTPVEQDIIFMFDEKDREVILDAIVSRKINIVWDNKKSAIDVCIKGKRILIAGENWFYPGSVYQQLRVEDSNIEERYDTLLNIKEKILSNAVAFIVDNYKGVNNEVKSAIPERIGLRVLDFDAKEYDNYKLEKRQLYDVVVIKWKNELFLVHESNNNHKVIGIIGKNNQLIKELSDANKIIEL